MAGHTFRRMSDDQPPPEWSRVIGDLLVEARRRLGKGQVLARRLEELGVVGENGARYSESSISNWTRGRARAPADAVLAAAMVAGISIDEWMHPLSSSSPAALQDALRQEIQKQVAAAIAEFRREPPASEVDVILEAIDELIEALRDAAEEVPTPQLRETASRQAARVQSARRALETRQRGS